MTVTMSFTGLTEPMMAGPHTSIFSGYVSKECVFRPDRFRAPGWCSTVWMSSITKPSGAPTKQSILSVQTLSMAIIGFSRSTIMTRTIPLIHQKNIWIDTLTTWTSCLCLPNYHSGELGDKPLFQKMDHKGAYNNHDSNNAAIIFDEMSEYDHKVVKAAYYAMIDLIDKQVGRLLDVLRETGELERTIVIFHSDHGEMLGDHGIYLKGPYFYEGAVHVPLIISCPEVIPAGRHVEQLVELIDLAPTLVEAVQLPHQPQMQGRSMWKLLTGGEQPMLHPKGVYSEYYNSMPWHKNPTAQCTMFFDGRYKVVDVHSTEEGELYDLENDPAETVNLWYNPAYLAIKAEMLRKLCDAMAFTCDPLPERISEW